MSAFFEECFIQVRRNRLHVVVEGDGPFLTLLHGFTGSAATLKPMADHLTKRFRVVRVDLPGHGLSDAPHNPACYEMESVLLDLDKVLDVLRAPRTGLFGYSMGGRVAMSYTATFPKRVDSLAVLGATPGLEDEAGRMARRRSDDELASFIINRGLEAFVDRWMANPLFASQSRLGGHFLRAARAQRMSNEPHALASCLRGMGLGSQRPVRDELARIDIPILLMAGDLDEKFSRIARALAPALPRARVALVGDAGHAAHLERPAEVHEVLERFFGETLDHEEKGQK